MTYFTLPTRRFRAAAEKLSWGVKVVGLMAALQGMARYAALVFKSPDNAEVLLKSGQILEFDFPSQFPPAFIIFGDYIDPEFYFLRDVAGTHWCVVDAGAAIGHFSIFVATTLSDVKVEAFEPSSANVATLRRNISRNNVGACVSVHQLALSNRKDVARFVTAPNSWNSQLAPEGADASGTEIVQVETLDAMLDALSLHHVDVLKINVAGFEPAVLEGAMQSLAAGRVDIMILLLGLPSLPHYAAIAALGYRFFYYHPRQRTLFEVTRFDADSVLSHRPWPARHIIAIRDAALGSLVAGVIDVRPLTETTAPEKPRRRQMGKSAAGGS
ncbi:FkbM family methyltransferase [Devosia sp. 2618]|uniref:FkbM family methyltransferase n=1 Tax=Devosia sp. 2618 TaxID=3156454 RepID=UPI003397598C